MRKTTHSRAGRLVLTTSHCAGMVDLVALPLWVGTLVSAYAFDPRQAGSLVTLFLIGAVVASMVSAPRFNRIDGRLAATAGFGVAAACFVAAAQAGGFAALALLHVAGGLAVGTALSFTHGTIGRSANPHRLFGIAGMSLGVFAILFMGITPRFITTIGGSATFLALGTTMAIATLLAAWGFPVADVESEASRSARARGQRLPPRVWLGIFGVGCMALVQAMVYSFVERMGADRGFGPGVVAGILVTIGVVNLFPSGLAALLQRRLPAALVLRTGPLLQATLALLIATSTTLPPFVVGSVLFVSVMLFTHTFAFGTLASMDVTGRVVAATPATIMVGSALGPVLGGTLASTAGYPAIGVAALVIDIVAAALFWGLTRSSHGSVGGAVKRSAF